MFFGIYRPLTANGSEKYRQTAAHATARDEQRWEPASRWAALPLPAHCPATSDQAASKPSQAPVSSGLRSTPPDRVEAGDPSVTNAPSAVTAAHDESEDDSNAKARRGAEPKILRLVLGQYLHVYPRAQLKVQCRPCTAIVVDEALDSLNTAGISLHGDHVTHSASPAHLYDLGVLVV